MMNDKKQKGVGFPADMLEEMEALSETHPGRAYRGKLPAVRQMQSLGIADNIIERMLGVSLLPEDRNKRTSS